MKKKLRKQEQKNEWKKNQKIYWMTRT
jgi:hypothetical protein